MSDVGILFPVAIGDARAFWPFVRDELESVRARYGEAWMVEDIWAEILAGNAYLWVAGTPDALEAFVILQIHARPYDRALHIWGAAERTQARVADYWPQILAIATEAQCSHVTIETPRRWERALPGASLRYLYSFTVE